MAGGAWCNSSPAASSYSLEMMAVNYSRRNVGAHNLFMGAVVGGDRLVASPFAFVVSAAVIDGKNMVASPVGATAWRESTLRHTILFSGHGLIIGTFALLWGAVLVGDHLVASPFAVTVLGLHLERRAAE